MISQITADYCLNTGTLDTKICSKAFDPIWSLYDDAQSLEINLKVFQESSIKLDLCQYSLNFIKTMIQNIQNVSIPYENQINWLVKVANNYGNLKYLEYMHVHCAGINQNMMKKDKIGFAKKIF